MEYELLGPLHVADRDGTDRTPRAPKVRRLLALLLVERGRDVGVDAIVEALWDGHPPASSVNLVQGYVRDLRRALGRDQVLTTPGGYRMPATVRVDLDEFCRRASARAWREALALWRGQALDEWSDEVWARPTAVRLEEDRLAALESRIGADVEEGRAAEVVGELRALLADHPLRESMHALLVRALYLGGRQGDALAAYQEARRLLVDELGVEPGPELRQLETDILVQDPTLQASRPSQRMLPVPLTPLLGRTTELAELGTLLAQSRLVTVTGPGGTGKTRLAIAAADDGGETSALVSDVWFVHLVAAASTEQVVDALATALRVTGPAPDRLGDLADYLATRRALLILDNCEQVVAEVADLVATLLRACPGLRVLATSRQPLGLVGEQVLPLSGLDPPTAVDLFTVRARAVNPHVQLPRDVVARIVGRLDELPLAVELAAARSVSLTAEQIEAGLTAPLELLTGEDTTGDPRHATIRAVFDWSRDLLRPDDRDAFAELSVLAGEFSLGAASGVVGADAPARVERLIARGLLARGIDVQGEARYRMLQVIREYARDAAAPEVLSSARDRHLAHHADLARRLHEGLRTARSPQWAGVGRVARDDLRAAVDHAFRTGSPLTGALVADLHWLWFLDGRLAEYRAWAEAARPVEQQPLVAGRLDRALASTAIAQGDVTASEQAARRLVTTPGLGPELTALGINLLGMAAWARGDPGGVQQYRRGLPIAREAEDPWVLLLVLGLAGRAAHAAGDHTVARELLDEAVERAEDLGEPMVLGLALDCQAHAAFAAGERDRADRLASQALVAYRLIDYQEGVASGCTLEGLLAVLGGRHEAAQALLGEAADLCRRMGHRGGLATVLEATALLRHEAGDRGAARAALRVAGRLRGESRTSTSPEVSAALRQAGFRNPAGAASARPPRLRGWTR